MKITFPHMGNLYIALKAVFEELGTEVVPPPKCSKRTLELGTRYSPELICIPLKVTVGNYIESIERGADTLFMWGGCDVCRISYYHMIQKDILKQLGYNIDMICMEPMKTPGEIRNFLQKLMYVCGTRNYVKMLYMFMKALKLLFEIDDLDTLAAKIRAREIHHGSVDRIYENVEKEMQAAKGYSQVCHIIRKSKDVLGRVAIDQEKSVLKVGIVGEIYTVLEPFINVDLVRRLGHMGVEVHRSVTASEFIKEQLDFLPFIHSSKEEVHRAAKPYLNTEIGGHARHTIGNTALYGEKNFDGVIHLLPFTCMPEIVAQSILPTVEKEKNIPILKLVLDEMTGEVGYMTRLEAFVDLLQKRRQSKVKYNSSMIY
ncbi:MAG: acyl-CoA dehydratase activase-related protein [Bacillota bacterium]